MDSALGKKTGSVMVVGGGISGMQASLDLAEAGFKVYLLESSPTIGGTMLQLDKTFPTNDCATCIGSPRLIEVAKHPNIHILASSDLLGIEGTAGQYRIRVKKRARYVKSTCTGCGDCVQVCPVGRPSEWDQGLRERKAIYRSFVQAVPSTYVIEKKDRAPCVLACPAGIHVQGYVQLIGQGKYREAIELIMDRLPLPGVLGRVCPHPCEPRCRRLEVDQSLSIRDLKRFAADQVHLEDLPLPEITDRPQRVAVVGSGPAGLTVAHYLGLLGYRVTLFEALPVLGGMLRVGIPDYRLPPEVLDREIAHILRPGRIEVQTNKRLGRDFSLSDLQSQGFQTIFLGIGAHRNMKLGISGEGELEGVLHAGDFLREVNLGQGSLPGQNIAVVGGGNVAVDAARTALRLGAREVSIVYRRTREEMPAYPEEIEAALSEGIAIHYLTAPLGIQGVNGRVQGLQCIRTELGEPDQGGRRRPVPVEGSEFTISCDALIAAIGLQPDMTWTGNEPGLEVSVKSTFVAHAHTQQTSLPHVFAAGDAVSGPATVIEAVASGRRAAEAMHRFLQGEDLAIYAETLAKASAREKGHDWQAIPPELSPRMRPAVRHLDWQESRTSFQEVEQAMTEEEARDEAGRCLNCGGCSECMECVRACKVGAVDHDMEDEELEVPAGALILAPGFNITDPHIRPEFGYGRYANVITSLEFERILSAAGPFEGHIVRPSDHGEPVKIAWIQCVGSRDASIGRDYCSYACCMYAIKQTIIAREHDHRIQPTVFYMDIRAQGKGFDRYYERAKAEHGVRFVRSMLSRVTEDPLNHNLKVHYMDEQGAFQDEEFDLVVLSMGFTPHPESRALAERLGISLDRFGFCESPEMNPTATSREGIFACGVFQAPKDIPDSVVQASSASACAMALLAEARGTDVQEEVYPEEREVLGEEPRIGVFICHCGINIAGVVDVAQVSAYAKTLPHVVYADHLLFSCSTDSQVVIREAMETYHLNRMVVASCSPRTHEPLFQDTLRKSGLNKYLFEMANIRDQCSWVHQQEPEKATDKARDLVRMSVARAALLEPLHQVPFSINQQGLVIGGGPAGMTAALNLADQGFQVFLVEKEKELGGYARHLHFGPRGENIGAHLRQLVEAVEAHPRVRVLKDTRLLETDGFVGAFQTRVQTGQGPFEVLEHGATIVATGATEYRPTEYGYGQDDRILTQREFQDLLARKQGLPETVKDIVMIQCVGSRNEERPYCSRICCTQAVSNALEAKKARPDARVAILYRDMRTFALYELLYKEAREAGVQFYRFEPENPPEVVQGQNGLSVKVLDQNLNEEMVLPAHQVVLSTGVAPDEKAKDLASTLKLPLDQDGFFLEAHIKLRPLDFANAGFFLCGTAHGPKFLEESMAQAKGAASRAAAILSKKQMMVGGEVAVVDRENCVVCLTCVRTCPFGVPKVAEDGFVRIEPAECRGCGNCASACPRKVITLQHMTDAQVVAKGMAICA